MNGRRVAIIVVLFLIAAVVNDLWRRQCGKLAGQEKTNEEARQQCAKWREARLGKERQIEGLKKAIADTGKQIELNRKAYADLATVESAARGTSREMDENMAALDKAFVECTKIRAEKLKEGGKRMMEGLQFISPEEINSAVVNSDAYRSAVDLRNKVFAAAGSLEGTAGAYVNNIWWDLLSKEEAKELRPARAFLTIIIKAEDRIDPSEPRGACHRAKIFVERAVERRRKQLQEELQSLKNSMVDRCGELSKLTGEMVVPPRTEPDAVAAKSSDVSAPFAPAPQSRLHLVKEGDTREQVLAKMGKPKSEMRSGNRLLLGYDGAYVELAGGKVVGTAATPASVAGGVPAARPPIPSIQIPLVHDRIYSIEGTYQSREDAAAALAKRIAEYRVSAGAVRLNGSVEGQKGTYTLIGQGAIARVYNSDVDIHGLPPSALPGYTVELDGVNKVQIENPNSFDIVAGIRSGSKGKNLNVPAFATRSTSAPDGDYELYFVHSGKPDALFKGDSFSLKGQSISIRIMQASEGNYRIQQVR